MYYALPEHLQETTLLLFMVCCLFISRKTAGLGAAGGFFHYFQKIRELPMWQLPQTLVLGHWRSY